MGVWGGGDGEGGVDIKGQGIDMIDIWTLRRTGVSRISHNEEETVAIKLIGSLQERGVTEESNKGMIGQLEKRGRGRQIS